MEKTRDLLKKIGDINGTFHSKMGTLESRNARTLQKQKKRWRDNTEEVYKRDLHDPEIMVV